MLQYEPGVQMHQACALGGKGSFLNPLTPDIGSGNYSTSEDDIKGSGSNIPDG